MCIRDSAHRDAVAGDPIERAVAVATLGRRHALRDRRRRIGLLLDVMVADPYPAVRHIAWRSLTRLAAIPDGYVPEARRPEREAWVARARPGLAPIPPDPQALERLRAEAAQTAIFIGE